LLSFEINPASTRHLFIKTFLADFLEIFFAFIFCNDKKMEILTDFWKPYSVIGKALIQFWWIVFPVMLFYLFKILWMDFVSLYSRFSWLKSLKWTYLEIIPPKDLEKGPQPMEAIFQGMSGVLKTLSVFETHLLGKFTDRFSLELVGLGGEAHYYIRTQTKYRNLIESQIYAQYPDAEIIEVEDYTKNFPKVVPNKKWNLWGTDVKLTDPDPYPIKTYDKFEESITGETIDPVGAFVELFNTLPPGQNIWIQWILCPLMETWRVDEMKEVQKLAGRINGETRGILSDLTDVITHIFQGMFGPVEFPKTEKKEEAPLEFRLTPVEKEKLKALEENLGKNAFRTKMRVIYIGRKEGFDSANVSALFGAIKQFHDLNSNSLAPDNQSKTYALYVAPDARVAYRQRKIYRRYRDRDMDGYKMVLSTTELATLFHFPNMNIKAPSLTRVESKKGSAPFNLPVK